MGLLKKNLVFTIIVGVCLLVFVAGAFLAFSESGKISQAKQKITSAETQLKNLRFADPAPSEVNVEAAQGNVAELKAELKSIREDLEQGSRLSMSSDAVGVMASIQQYISEYRRKAAAHTDDNGLEDPIELPKDFGFGFEQYVSSASPFEDPELNKLLDKQRQILSYLLNKLYDANPDSIVAVKREVLEQKQAAGSGDKGFRINPAVSAKVPGAINTLAFSLTFTGYTNSLREFLNNLAKFDLPIVVRSIDVKRPTGQSTTVARTNSNNLDSIFGVFGGGTEAEVAEPEVAQKPVISENISTFNVVLEFIEIVLPADTAEDNV
jgi:hypothetical protein